MQTKSEVFWQKSKPADYEDISLSSLVFGYNDLDQLETLSQDFSSFHRGATINKKSGDKANASMVQEKIAWKSAKKANELLETVAKSCPSLSNENNEV